MKISNVKIYDMVESIVASGLPMMAKHSEKWIVNEVMDLNEREDIYTSAHFCRAYKLAKNPPGSGHNNFLSGILVSMDVTATVKWWEQFQRYHFKQIVSSMSTMHRLRKMAVDGTIQFNPLTNPDMVKAFILLAKDETVTDEELAYACPMGLELTARITTNYLQLKTIKNQRKNHKLTEWKTFVEWIDSLPFAGEFIGC